MAELLSVGLRSGGVWGAVLAAGEHSGSHRCSDRSITNLLGQRRLLSFGLIKSS